MEWIQKRGYLLGTASLATLVLGGYLAIGWAPPDVNQHDVMRIMYVHVPSAWTAYLGFFGTLIGSVLYLWKQDTIWDTLAVAAAEIGVLMTALTLATGSTWGRPIWGVWWTWDPRLTSTAILFVIYSGYLMLRALQTNPAARARQAAVIGIIGFIDIPIVHFSVLWWRSLHQGPTVLKPNLGEPSLDDRMEVALMVNMLAFTLLFVFLLGQRMRLARLEARRDQLLYEEVRSA
ncbi:MAG: cytochrome c biogenesis protein CcsA [Chloroflexota bacterium]